MTTLYPDVPFLLTTAGAARFPPPQYRVSTDLPADLQSETVIQVERIGGPVTVPTLDEATVSVDVWASDRATVGRTAQEVRHWLMHEIPGATITTPDGTATIARVRELSGPGRRPTADPDLRRIGMSFQVVTHSH